LLVLGNTKLTHATYRKDCGSTLRYLKQRKGYVCGKHHRYGKDFCTSHIIKEDVISSKIRYELKVLDENLDTEDIIKSLKAIKKDNKKLSSEQKRIEKAIASNTLKKEKLLDLLLSETIDEDLHYLKMTKLKNEALTYEENLVKLLSQSENDAIYSHDRLIKEISEIKSFDTINRNYYRSSLIRLLSRRIIHLKLSITLKCNSRAMPCYLN